MKISIGILEDEQMFSEMLKNSVLSWAREKECLAEIKTYLSGDSLLLDFESGIIFDMLFLDVMLPSGPNGMQVAKTIRAADPSVILVFLTSNLHYINEGYDVNALQYLIKPIRYPRLKKYLDKAYDIISDQKPTFYLYKNKIESSRILFHEILYFTSSDQHIEIHTQTKIFKEWKRLKDIERNLPIHFVRCHRAFIVNIEAIRSIQQKTIVLMNYETIPIGDAFIKQVKDKWMYYYG